MPSSRCKITAMKSISIISLDHSSCRNFFLGSCSRFPSQPEKHWSSLLLPQLFRLIIDKSRIESQFIAAEVILILLPLYGNLVDVMNFLATMFILECVEEGRVFLKDLHCWRVKPKIRPGSIVDIDII